MVRQIHVSNRAADPRSTSAIAGGLDNTLKAGGNVVRIAWSGKTVADGTYNFNNPFKHHCEEFFYTGTDGKETQYVFVDLPEKIQKAFYELAVNQIFWPAQHGREDIANISMGMQGVDISEAVQSYYAVNDIFAKVLKSFVKGDDVIIAHDNHLGALAQSSKELGVMNPMGFMLHIPMVAADRMGFMDDEVYGFIRQTFTEDVFAYDMVGLQAPWDLENFQKLCGNAPSPKPDSYDQLVVTNNSGKSVLAGVFPATSSRKSNLAILSQFQSAAETHEFLKQAFPETGRDVVDMVGADRLDYTKGLPMRLEAVRLCVERFGADPKYLHLIQAAASSRDDVYGYKQEQDRYRELYVGVLRDYGNVVYTPYSPDGLKSTAVKQGIIFSLYSKARVGIFASAGPEGMHLGAAGEFLDCQNPNNPGVMLMTSGLGAAHDYRNAGVVVDPNPLALAEGMMRARSMPLEQRQQLYQIGLAMREQRTNARWVSALVNATIEGAHMRHCSEFGRHMQPVAE